jgi:hypothetical protein
MKRLNIFLDRDYPPFLIEALQKIHSLQKTPSFNVFEWDKNIILRTNFNESVFLLVDYQMRGLSESIKKHLEDGYRIMVCKPEIEKLDYFEFAMTVLRVWPFIIEKGIEDDSTFCYTFRYGGRKLKKIQ